MGHAFQGQTERRANLTPKVRQSRPVHCTISDLKLVHTLRDVSSSYATIWGSHFDMSTRRDQSHSQSHPKPYKCSLCEGSFLREAHLKRHLALRKFFFEADLLPKDRKAHDPQMVAVNNISARVVALSVEGRSHTSSFLEDPSTWNLFSPSTPLLLPSP